MGSHPDYPKVLLRPNLPSIPSPSTCPVQAPTALPRSSLPVDHDHIPKTVVPRLSEFHQSNRFAHLNTDKTSSFSSITSSGSSDATPQTSSKHFYFRFMETSSNASSARRLATAALIPQPVAISPQLVAASRLPMPESQRPSYRKMHSDRANNPRARKRSANISELSFSHLYHPTDAPFNRIRVWKNNRNLQFYDCNCGRRKAVQDLKKILNHVSKNCRLTTIDKSLAGASICKDDVSTSKATPADIAAAAAILTMSTTERFIMANRSRTEVMDPPRNATLSDTEYNSRKSAFF